MLPVLIILASVLIGTGSVLLLREKMNEEQGTSDKEQGEISKFQEANDKQISSSDESNNPEQANENTNSSEQPRDIGFSSPQTSENTSTVLETESTDANYLTASDFKDLDKISYLSDTISNDELEDSKISLVGESGDFVDNLHLGETLKIQGGEGIDTEVLNNEVVVSGEDASVSNKGVAKYTDAQFTVTDGNVEIDDIYVKNTGDSVDGDLVLNGNLNANGNVVVRDDATVNGNLTGNKGLSVTGGNINLNVSSNYPTNINTGTSTGNISLGSGSNSISLDSSDWDISGVGKLTGISGIDNDGYYTQTGTDANTFTGVTTFSNPTYSALFTGGNVGIGTTAPQAMLQIGRNIVSNVPANTALYIEGPRSLRFGSSDGNPNYGSYFIPNYTLPNESSLTIGIRANGGSNYDRISISKNGIGMGGSESKGGTVLYVNPSIWSGTSVSVIRTGFSSTGSFTNGYGLYVENPTATITNKYAIVTEAGSGNVGIGTITPTALLHVTGTTLFQNSANAVNSYQFNNATGTSVMSVDTTNERVGIGTTAPGGTLSISNNTSGYGFDALQVWAPNLWNNQSFNIRFGAASTQSVFIGYHYGPSDGGNYFSIDHYGDAAGLGLNIAKGGNVGIGVLRGGRTLEVLDSSNPQLRLSQTQSSFYTDLQTTSAGNLYINPSGGSVGIGTTAPGGTLSISNNTSGYGFDALQVWAPNLWNNQSFNIRFGAASTQSVFIGYHYGPSDGGNYFSIDHYGDAAGLGLNIAKGGNVGIGVLRGGRTLEVLDSSNPQLRLSQTQSSFYTDLQTTSAGNLYINPSGGNVGIGTTAPLAPLHIQTSSATKAKELLRLDNSSMDSTNNGTSIYFGQNGTQYGRIANYYRTDVGWLLSLGHNGSSDDLTVLQSGNVGIGTLGPAYKLSVVGSAEIMGGGLDGTLGDSIVFASTSYQTSYFNKIRNSHSNSFANSTMSFELSSGELTTTEVMRLKGGNVGIGTTSPASKLEISGTGTLLRLRDTSTGYSLYTNFSKSGPYGGLAIRSYNDAGSNPSVVIGNTSTGTQAMDGNVVIGQSALYNSYGVNSVVIGNSASYGSCYGCEPSYNVILGNSAGYSNNASQNVYIGNNSGYFNQTGAYNVAIGSGSLRGASGNSHSNNTAIGYQTGYSTTTGGNNFFGGYQAGYLNQTGAGIVAIGYQAGYSNTANSLVAIGYQAGYNNTVGHENYFGGYQAGYSNTTGFINTFSGYKSGYLNLSGSYNTAFGNVSLYSNTTGGNNTAIGFNTLYQNSTGSNNTAVGWDSLGDSISSSSNTGVGAESLRRNITGNSNTAIGNGAIAWNTSGSSNVAIGVNSLHYGDGGDNNIILGNGAGYFLTGDNNVFIGHQAGGSSSVTSGTGNVFLGYQAGYSETGSNKLYIDNSNTATPLIGGDFSTDTLTITGQVVVGSPTGGAKGAGTINATAVYDDNVLLTDYVFDKYFDGTVRVSDAPLHADYSMLSLDQMADYISTNRHLPTIPGREEWERNGKFSLGVLANHLWETAETQALYVVELNNDIKEINGEWIIENGESEIEQLKARVAELENSKVQETIDQTVSNDSNSNDNASVTNENVNENLNSNDNVAIDPAVVLPEADKSANSNENINSNENSNSNSNDNLNIDQEINDQLSLLGIGDIGGTITAFFKEVWFEAQVTFEKAVVFAAEVTFGSEVSFEKPVELSADSVGQATVLAGTNSVVIAFENSYEEAPVVTLTLASNTDLTKYYVSDVTTTSFTINIEPTQTADTLFNWHAFGKTKKADGGTQKE